VQGIIAAGGNPSSFKPGGKTPFDYLAANQEADGHYRYAIPGAGTSSLVANQSPVWTTGQALGAVTETPFPIAAVARAKQPRPAAPPSSEANRFGSTGGVSPASVAPGPAPERHGAKPQGSSGATGSGEGAVAPGRVAPAGQGSPEGSAAQGTSGLGAPPTESPATSDEPVRTSEPEQADSGGDGSGGVAVAILAGLLAGCLLFALGWVARRAWIRRR
jgi:hypothetical protein